MRGRFITFVLFFLLLSCNRPVPPEITQIENLIRDGKLVEAEDQFDRLPEKLRRKNEKPLFDLGLAYLTRHLKNPEQNLRYHAMVSYFDIKEKEHIPIFFAGLVDPFYKVQTTSAEALGELQDERYRDTLATLLESDKEEARFLAAAVFLKFGDLRGLPVLQEILLKGVDVQNRQKAAQVLGKWGPGKQELTEALKLSARMDPNYFVRIESYKALGLREGPKDALEGLATLRDTNNIYVHLRVLATLAFFGDVQATQELLGTLHAEDPLLRLEAVLTAGDLGFKETFPLLFNMMISEDIPSRMKAALLLGKAGETQDLPEMKRVFLEINDRLLRINFLKAIADLGGKEEISFMKDLLPNDDPFVEIYAARGLCFIYNRIH